MMAPSASGKNVPASEAAQALTLSAEDKLKATFRNIDIDGNGTIDKKELWARRSTVIGQGIMGEQFDALFDTIDTDKSGTIDFGEYCSFICQAQNANHPKIRGSLIFLTQCDSLRAGIMKPSAKARDTSQKQAKQCSLLESGRIRSQEMFLSTHHQASFTKDTPRKLDLNCDSEHKVKIKQRRSASVRFFDVEVREYDVTASDNPCVRSGAALELGWDYSVAYRLRLDTFEEKRSTERSKNFNEEKRLSKEERDKILREFGATTKDIQEAGKRAAIIRNKRRKSIAMMNLDKYHEAWENKLLEIKKKISLKKKNDIVVKAILF